MKPIQCVENSSNKRLLLDPLKIRTFEDISEEDRKYLESNLGVGQNDFGQMSVDLNVDNFLPPTMLKAVLPTEEVEGKHRPDPLKQRFPTTGTGPGTGT